ncbi:MAG TPA: Rid family hydrolase [Casimicrobiaceae bacterium]|nr:Rid family hydrolase [Casimicrobiaceae bacterium]
MSSPATGTKQYAYLPGGDASTRRFPNAIRIGDTIHLSSEPIGATVAAAPPDIQQQTHRAFADFVALLEAVGARMADLVKLHTFYVYDGANDRATAYWEKMTEVRLQYFANPGPAGTALRAKGAPTSQRLIAIDGVACPDPARQRIMPTHAWDWSMPTPLSQGWRVGPVVYAGGQISADRRGRTVAADDLRQQVVNTMEFLRHVLVDAGAGFDDIVSLKIGYQDRGDPKAARAVLDEILRTVQPLIKRERCTLTCLGIDLLYEGLQLEIDANAVIADGSKRTVVGVDRGWCGAPGFAAATRVGDRVHIGAIGAPEGRSIADQLHTSLQRLDATLRDVGARAEDLVKLNVLFTSDEHGESGDCATLHRLLSTSLPTPGPVISLVRVAGLPQPGQRVQVDGVAITQA